MEGTKNKLVILLAFLVFPGMGAHAQKKDLAWYQCAFFENYRAGNMTAWPALITEMGKVQTPDLAWKIEMLKGIYGLVGYQIAKREKDLAKTYVNKADKYFDKLLEEHPLNAQLHSLAGAFYGYKIALAFYKAPFYGPKSMYHIEKAIELDHAEPMGLLEKGNSLYYRPVVFGGDKLEGLNYYQKALKLLESKGEQKCDWQKLLLRAFILKSLYETNQLEAAAKFQAEMQRDYGKMDWIQQFVGAKFMEEK
jgi:hypothetical protein